MAKQVEMFPKTQLEDATEVLQHLEGELERANLAVEKAQDKAYGMLERVTKQKHVVKLLQSQMPAVDAVTGEVQG